MWCTGWGIGFEKLNFGHKNRIANPGYLEFDIANVEQRSSSEFVIPWFR